MQWPPAFLEPDADLARRHVRHFFDDEFASISDVVETLSCLGRSAQVGPNLRVLVDGRSCAVTRCRVIDQAPASREESLESWAERLFSDQPFWVVVNEVELFNEALAVRAARAVQPLIEAHAAWFGGLQIALVIGRKGFTPLGAHVDSDCRWNFHFHLGPAPKSVIVWPEGQLLDAPMADMIDPGRLVDRGISASLSARDLFVLPCQAHHVGRYDGLAVTVIVSFKLLSERMLLESAFASLLDARARKASARRVPLMTARDVDIGGLDIDSAQMQQQAETDRLLRQSNLGFTVKRPDNRRRVDWANDVLAIVSPFPIHYQQIDPGRLQILARGHRILIPNDRSVVELIVRFNAGQSIPAKSVSATGSVRAVLGLLLSHSAIQRSP